MSAAAKQALIEELVDELETLITQKISESRAFSTESDALSIHLTKKALVTLLSQFKEMV